MLVLRRKIGKAVLIDGTISVRLIRLNGQRARLAITAPPSVRVVRGELLVGEGAELQSASPTATELDAAVTTLVLSRKAEETVVLSNGTTITVIEIRGSYVALGFDGPSDVHFRREELPPLAA